jgi:hypothetical protein
MDQILLVYQLPCLNPNLVDNTYFSRYPAKLWRLRDEVQLRLESQSPSHKYLGMWIDDDGFQMAHSAGPLPSGG